jgi:hypothetical protein
MGVRIRSVLVRYERFDVDDYPRQNSVYSPPPWPVQLWGLVPFVSPPVPSGHVVLDQMTPLISELPKEAAVKFAPVKSALVKFTL